jgi:hypothetical protein
VTDRPSGPASETDAPWPNFGRGLGTTYPAAASASRAPVQPKPPRATTTRKESATSAISWRIQGWQVSRSSVVGLLSGGAHRTVATIRAPSSRWPSPECSEVGCAASPTRCSDANSQSPDESPVNTRPVRLPPLAAGARPTISTDGCSSPQPAIGRPQ